MLTRHPFSPLGIPMEALFDRIPRLGSNISAQNAERRWRILNKREWEKEGRKEKVLRVGVLERMRKRRKRTKRWEVFVNRFAGILNIRENNERFLWRSLSCSFDLLSLCPFPLPSSLSLSLSTINYAQSQIIHVLFVIFPVRKLKYLWIAMKKSFDIWHEVIDVQFH